MTSPILTCTMDRWALIWGDPLLSGTAIMLAYALAAALTFRAAWQGQGEDRAYWWLCAWVLLFQMANTHLDLHAVPGALARCMAHAQGWYAQRGLAKLLAAAAIGVVVLAVSVWLLLRYGAAAKANLLLTAGMVLCFGLTLGHGIKLGGFEAFYGRPFGPVTTGLLIEASGIVLVGAAALRRGRSLG